MAIFGGPGRRGPGPSSLGGMSIELTGDRALRDFLKEFPDVVLRGGVRDASAKAFRPIRAAAKKNAKAHSDSVTRRKGEGKGTDRWADIAAAMVLRQKLIKRRGIIYTKVTVNPKVMVGGDSIHKLARLLEFGTAPHKIGSGNHPGTKPQSFIRKAWDTGKARAKARFGAELRNSIIKAAAKERRRLERKYGTTTRPIR